MKVIPLFVLLLAVSTAATAQSPGLSEDDQAAVRTLRRCASPFENCGEKKFDRAYGRVFDLYRGGADQFFELLLSTSREDHEAELFEAGPERFLTRFSSDTRNRACLESWFSPEHFQKVRATLRAFKEKENRLAQLCLKSLETANADQITPYFPPATFNDRLWYRHYMASRLYAIGETPIWNSVSSGRYRLYISPSFGLPSTIDLECLPDGTARLRLRIVRGHPLLRVVVDQESELTATDLVAFQRHVERASFWSLRSILPSDPKKLHLDGINYLLEGAEGARYNAVERNDQTAKEIDDIVSFLIDKTGWKQKEGEQIKARPLDSSD